MFIRRLGATTGRCMQHRFLSSEVPGFRVAGISAGMKKKAGKKDFAMIVSDHPCSAAAVFTQNVIRAAPVTLSEKLLRDGEQIGAVVINAGCANACTGEQGYANAVETVAMVNDAVGLTPLVMSTGVIGAPLNMDKMAAAVQKATAALNASSWQDVSEAVMTTDTYPKLRSREYVLEDKVGHLTGFAKGSGMIHPNMATMLSTVATDVAISSECLQEALRYAVDRTFNCCTVDGDTSTNDTCAVLANGAAGNPLIKDNKSDAFLRFRTELTSLMTDLAKEIARDGEGATKFITIYVKGADSHKSARTVGRSVATSPLVKTALFGNDANWGRILCAAGYAGVPFDPTKVSCWVKTADVDMPPLQLLMRGQPFDIDDAKATKIMSQKNVDIVLDLCMGDEEAEVWTCDFSYDYVKINGDYRS